jgi:hypothetical protein
MVLLATRHVLVRSPPFYGGQREEKEMITMASGCLAFPIADPVAEPIAARGMCEHRTVSRDGRIVCAKIVEGGNEVSPDVCRTCPLKAVNCAHLRFSLKQITPTPLVVRYNGRTEIWDDDPAEVRFEQSACSAKVMPIQSPKQCVGCTLRQAIEEARPEGQTPGPVAPPKPKPRRRRQAPAPGNVVPFPGRRVAAAAG